MAPEAAGGLGVDATMLGWILSISGGALLVFQLAVFPALSRRFSITRLCLVGTATSGFLYALLPFMPLFRHRTLVIVMLLVQQSLLRFSLGTAFTCTFTVLNNCVPAEARGRMQGVAMMIGSLSRAIGPTMGAELFAWSLTNGLRFPFDVHFVFMLMCILNLAPVALALSTFTPALDLPMPAAPPSARPEGDAATASSSTSTLATATELTHTKV